MPSFHTSWHWLITILFNDIVSVVEVTRVECNLRTFMNGRISKKAYWLEWRHCPFSHLQEQQKLSHHSGFPAEIRLGGIWNKSQLRHRIPIPLWHLQGEPHISLYFRYPGLANSYVIWRLHSIKWYSKTIVTGEYVPKGDGGDLEWQRKLMKIPEEPVTRPRYEMGTFQIQAYGIIKLLMLLELWRWYSVSLHYTKLLLGPRVY
jgi:hypothetical protein